MARQNTNSKIKLYRLTLIEDSTHKSIRTIRFSKLLLISSAAAAVIAIILIIYCAIAFTPLRKTIPGYPDAHSKKVALENAIKIDSLENAMTRWSLYVTNLRNLFAGEDHISIDSLISSNTGTNFLSSKSIGALQRQDSLLRQTVIAEEQFGIAASATRQLPIEGIHFFAPAKGIVSTEFDAVLHPAVDISTSKGAIISAVLDGTVIVSKGSNPDDRLVIIQHSSDIVSVYSNLDNILVSSGDAVKAGSPIAIAGPSVGTANSYQLHFELWHRGEARNPVQYIKL